VTLTIGSLFSGTSALDQGVQSVLPARTIWHSDIKPAAVKLLAHRFPDVPNLGDITKVGWARVERPDIITGGSPCQDLSHAGKRGGMRDGTRSNLWVAMREAIAQLRPALVVWENVRGAYSAPADSEVEPCPGCVGDDPGTVLWALGRVLGDLSALGYDTAWCGLRAADVGAPHGRFRIFLTAWPTADTNGERSDERCSAAPRQETSRWALGRPPGRRGAPAVADAEHGPVSEWSRPAWREAGERPPVGLQLGCGGDTAADADDAARHGQRTRPLPWQGSPIAPADADAAGSQGPQPASGRDLPDRGATADTDSAGGEARRGRPGTGNARRPQPLGGGDAIAWGPYAPAIRRWESVLGRPAPSPTETGPKGGQRLNPALTEWMMGLPAGWICDVPGLSRSDMLSLAGDGVVPQQATEALRRLLPIAFTEAAA
jgi:DNA (cytosine-5)-methyltransferase 1